MRSSIKPIFLLADSQILFWRKDGVPFLQRLGDLIESREPRAAYIGASNDDNPEFHTIFVGAMELIGIKTCRIIPSVITEEDKNFLLMAEIILLGGGDAVKGWRTFASNGLRELLVERYFDGAILMGVSAGAMQLGLYAWPEGKPSPDSLISTFGLVPFIISPHDEKLEWAQLRSILQTAHINFSGIGIPTGGGMIYHVDHSVEPVRLTLREFSLDGGRLKDSLLSPSGDEEICKAPFVC